MSFGKLAGIAVICAATTGARAMAQIQRPVVVSDRLSCGLCTVLIDTIATLGATDGPGSLAGPPVSVRVDGLGRYWVLEFGRVPKVFRPDGSFLQSVGKTGQGPGEFYRPYDALALPGDSVLVLDFQGRRAIVVGRDLSPGRTVQVPALVADRALLLEWPRAVLITAWVPSREAVGWPLHVFSLAGREATPLLHFGPDSGIATSGVPPDGLLHQLAPAKQGAAWSADRGVYRLTLWNSDGTKARTLTRDSDWFRGAFDMLLGTPKRPPPSRVAAINEDADGLLWVFVNVAGPKWREAWPRTAQGERETSVGAIDFDKLHERVVEVIDPTAARVVTRGFLNGQIITSLPMNRLATYSLGAGDVPQVHILSLRLRGR
jgi:hypothetical protein